MLWNTFRRPFSRIRIRRRLKKLARQWDETPVEVDTRQIEAEISCVSRMSAGWAPPDLIVFGAKGEETDILGEPIYPRD